MQRLVELMTEVRSALSEGRENPLPMLPEPATADQLAMEEMKLGFVLPAELRSLYQLTRGGSDKGGDAVFVGMAKLVDITRLAETTAVLIRQYGIIKADLLDFEPDRYIGEVPRGQLVAFALDQGMGLFLEVDGPLAGRVVAFDFHAGSNYIWNRLGDSLEGFFRWNLSAVLLGGITAASAPGRSEVVMLLDCGRQTPLELDRMRTFLRQLRPVLQATGSTAGAFINTDPDSIAQLGLADVVP